VAPASEDKAAVREFTIASDYLVERRTVTVFLPAGYDRNAKYPVLFCADGQAVHDFSHTLTRAIERSIKTSDLSATRQ
jgi:predicted alpha/beta superfamily hydrolase